jgi:hypothetical protein
MEIEIRKDTSEKISKASKILGLKKKELVDRAILLYLDSISRYTDLKQEMREWDVLSDEALMNFEEALPQKRSSSSSEQ